MNQNYLNIGFLIVGLTVIVLGVSALFGVTPYMVMSFVWNLFVYLFFFLGFQVTFPFIIGFLTKQFAIPFIDQWFDENQTVPAWIQVIFAIALGLIISYCWIILTPKFAVLRALSLWPLKIFRWLPGNEFINYWHVAWYFITTVLGYLVSGLNQSS